MSGGLSTRGLGAASAGLFRPTVAELPVPAESPVVSPEPVGEESRDTEPTPTREKSRRAVGTKQVKVQLPAALFERLALAGVQSGRKPSAVVVELLKKHLPRLSIRQG